jgi:RimJ/RimL family protein N-acetyltransferase
MRDEKKSSANERVQLRDVVAEDLPVMFEFQLDPESNQMAAVIPRGREAFFAVWNNILADPTVVAKAIVVDGEMVGQIGCFQSHGQDCIGYWIGKPFWGRGFASRGVELFLKQVPTRPLHSRVAKHNVGSIRVLEKNGFKIVGYEHSQATERYLECDEMLFLLE